MRNNRILTAGSLLPITAILVILAAVMGCDSSEERDDITRTPSDTTSEERAAGDARSEEYGGSADDPSRAADRDQSFSGTSDEAATNAQYSLAGTAVAQISPTAAGNARGTVTFTAGEERMGMRVTIELEGLEPGAHGIHVHEVGDCSADDASSAGGHFNPYDDSHGAPDASEKHLGDMGNVEADGDGRISTEMSVQGLAFSGPASILQKAVIIHKNADDLESQPSGKSGDPVGCGVIRIDDDVLAK